MPKRADVARLIAIVQGEPKGTISGGWRHLWRKQSTWYTLDEQLAAVVALAELDDEQGLGFLRSAYEPTIETRRRKGEYAYMPGSGDLPADLFYNERHYVYNNTGEPLRSALYFCVGLDLYTQFDSGEPNEDELRSESEVERLAEEIKSRSKVHQVFKTALQTNTTRNLHMRN